VTDRLEKCLSSLITSLLAVITSLAFLLLPTIFLYLVFMEIMGKGRDLVIASMVLLVLTGVYNIIVFLSTRKAIVVEKSRLERTIWVCLRIGGSLFAVGLVLTVFILLAGLLESASKL